MRTPTRLGWEHFHEGPRQPRPKQPQRPRGRVVTYVLNNDQVAESLNKQDPANDEIPLNQRLASISTVMESTNISSVWGGRFRRIQ